jgi:hypothetical protein
MKMNEIMGKGKKTEMKRGKIARKSVNNGKTKKKKSKNKVQNLVKRTESK